MTTRPRPPRAMMCRSTARVSSSGAVRLVATVAAICSGEVWMCRLSWPTAALLTSASSGPSRAAASRMKVAMPAASVTSTVPTWSESGCSAARASSSGVSVRANVATRAPRASVSRTIARPRPRDPPETRTQLAAGMGVRGSDIALQRLLDRDLVQQADAPRDGVVGKPVGAPAGELGGGDRGVEDEVRSHDGADERCPPGADLRPGDVGVSEQHAAHGRGGGLGATRR